LRIADCGLRIWFGAAEGHAAYRGGRIKIGIGIRIGGDGRVSFAGAVGIGRLEPGGGQAGGEGEGELIGDRSSGSLAQFGGLGGQGAEGLKKGGSLAAVRAARVLFGIGRAGVGDRREVR